MDARPHHPVIPLGRHRAASSPGPMDHSILSLYHNVEIPAALRAAVPLISHPVRRMSASYPVIPPTSSRNPRVIREAVLHSRCLSENSEAKPSPSVKPKMEFYASKSSPKPPPRVEDLPLPPEEWLLESSGSESGSVFEKEDEENKPTDPVMTHTHTVMQLRAQFLTVTLKTLLRMSA
ncbi:uncharacterized protein LOC129598715 [Paramacrobiotus metropolitanus]|uniref:uncharacterized protein LOC129598715 n=1 Tax=Paramacrobiotus metropolitanus TaxID=2943436 RepID=UPI002445A6A5|nr:uncharacterized protein LOC129598715 [Paramacrobiotus metropolitanus]